MYSPELSAVIAANYILGVNSIQLGIYHSSGICRSAYPNDFSIPDYLSIDNVFSRYVHHYYFLAFIGNLKSSPWLMTILCALYCVYDFVLVLADVLFCTEANNELVNNGGLLITAYFRFSLTTLIVGYWIVVIFASRFTRQFEISAWVGRPINYLLKKTLTCRFFKQFHDVFIVEFDFPIRIKTAGMVAIGLCTTNALIVRLMKLIIVSYKIYTLIDTLQGYLNYLRSEPYEKIFAYIEFQSTYAFTVGRGREALVFIIDLLTPIYPCIVVAVICGLMISFISVFNLFYSFKRIILKIREEGEDGEYLKEIWKFQSHNSIFFAAQFVISCFFLGYIFAIAVFFGCFALSFKESQVLAIDFIKSRPATFWVALIPTMLGYFTFRTFYFPLLNDKYNFIKNQAYFSLVDTWYFLIGNFGALIKASFRYLIAVGSILLLGYRAHMSIMPAPFDRWDTLYCGFYGCVVVQCLKEGIVPTYIREQLAAEEPVIEGTIN